MTRTTHLLALLALVIIAAPASAQFGGEAGSFMRLGYGARSIGMGNAGAAYTGPEALVLYNPASSAFCEEREVYASYSSLGLDRQFNTAIFTAPIGVFRKKGADSVRTRVSTIGVSVGIVNAAVNNIDARDADGEQIGVVSTYENFYFGSFAIRFKPNFSFGVLVRFFDAKLWDNIKSSGVALDLGAIYRLNDELQIAAVIQNLTHGGYRWDTSPVYQQRGQVTEDKFPTLFKIGAAYHPVNITGTAYAEIEQSTVATTVIRGGAEYALNSVFMLRAGIDGYDLQHRLATQVHPTFGVSVRPTFDGFTPSFHYAAVIEPIAGGLSHVLSLGFQF